MTHPICLDFETEAIVGNPTVNPPKPVGLAVWWPGEKPRYLSWGHPTGNNAIWEDGARLIKEAWESKSPLLFHNAKFDLAVAMKWFHVRMPPIERIHDTLYLLFLHDPHAKSLALKPSSERLLGMSPDEQDSVADWLREHKIITGKQKPGPFICKAPGTIVAPYAIGDVRRTVGLFNLLHPDMDEGMARAYYRELRLLPILMANERRGLRVDVHRLEVDVQQARASLAKADGWLQTFLKKPDLNLDADADVAAALKDTGVVEVFDKTPTGKDSTSKKTLVAERFSDPRVWQVLGYRNRLKTLLSMSMEPWLTDARGDGCIHTEWNQVRSGHGNDFMGTRTGRLSCSRFQNIAKELGGGKDGWTHPSWLKGALTLPLVRDYILPDAGEVWLHRDYSQQEFRIVAHYAEGEILRTYQEYPTTDFHDAMAARLSATLGRKLDRSTVKGISFGILYGMGLDRLATHLKISREEAQSLRFATKKAMPDVIRLDDELKQRARHKEPIRTWGGRLYYCEEAEDGRDLSYKMLNVLVQGSAADCTKEAVCRLHEAGLSMLLTVHDEINLSTNNVNRDDKRLREVMEGIEFDVKMLTEKKVGPTWGQIAKETK